MSLEKEEEAGQILWLDFKGFGGRLVCHVCLVCRNLCLDMEGSS